MNFFEPSLRLLCGVAAGTAALAVAQTAPPASSPLRCAQLLSADQVKTIAGPGMEALPPKQHEAGESECIWRRGSGAASASLAFRFFDRQAIGGNPVTRTVDGYFEMMVKAGEEVGDKKREPVAGVPRAAIIQGNAQFLVVVQRADGVARAVTGNLNRNQAVALAKVLSAQ